MAHGLSAYKRIRAAMRRNEVEFMAYLRRQGGIWHTGLLGRGWSGAFDRLYAAGRIRMDNGFYVAQPGAGPVTPAVR
jgi:hypothetical protein